MSLKHLLAIIIAFLFTLFVLTMHLWAGDVRAFFELHLRAQVERVQNLSDVLGR